MFRLVTPDQPEDMIDLTVEISPDKTAELRKKAESAGISLEEYLAHMVRRSILNGDLVNFIKQQLDGENMGLAS